MVMNNIFKNYFKHEKYYCGINYIYVEHFLNHSV